MDSATDLRKRQVSSETEVTTNEDANLLRPVAKNQDAYDSPEPSGTEETCNSSDELLEQQRSYELRVQKERWPNTFEGLAALSSYVIGIGNIWFFPFLCARYGGAAFFIPYISAYLIVGIPMMYIEMALGQYTSMNPYMLFDRLCNGLSGIAPAMFIVVLYRSFFFSGILSHALYVSVVALTGSVLSHPWSSCKAGSTECFDLSISHNCQNEIFAKTGTNNFSEAIIAIDSTNLTSACQDFAAKMYTGDQRIPAFAEYTIKNIFKLAHTIKDLESPYIGGFVTLLFLWIITAVLSTTGLRILGKASYVFSIAPLISVLFMFIKSFTYHDSLVGMGHFLKPEFGKILDFGAWSDAVILVLFSLSIGDGGLIKIAMHNKFNNNVMRDVFLVASLDFVVSLLAGVAFFGVVGELGRLIYPEDPRAEAFKQLITTQGHSLAFIAFPELVFKETLGWLQMTIFYFTVFLLGLQSMVTSMDVLVTSMIDSVGVHRYSSGHFFIVLVLFILGFVCSVFFVMPSGIYLIKMFEIFTNFSLLFICTIEVIAVIYIYGFRRFASNIQTMMGGGKRRLYPFWWINWLFLTPLYLLIALIFKLTSMLSLTLGTRLVMAGYIFHPYLELSGLVITGTIVMWIPIVFAKKLWKAKKSKQPFWTILTCDSYWGPAETDNRKASRARELAHRVL
ncbi:hypothetical protein QR680_016694 [Steinernema hermaphroditum]|uniref:Transporter n=1 Tax=Steinernema hermaphroditum TaxID=289476 RepID=A0AA39HDZ6_9BILA|nr:hypothetical protein QR680_016694 [Steinernema hermaphroditum]